MATRRRRTVQKTVVEETLAEAGGHVSAEVVYQRARERLPRISLGTVYRNLRQLAGDGFVDEVAGPGGRALFAPAKEAHHHVRCLSCGRVEDLAVPVESVGDILRAAAGASGFVVKAVAVDVAGFCPGCQGSLGSRRREK